MRCRPAWRLQRRATTLIGFLLVESFETQTLFYVATLTSTIENGYCGGILKHAEKYLDQDTRIESTLDACVQIGFWTTF